MKTTKSVLLSCIAALSIVANSVGASASTVDLTNNTGVNLNQSAVILEDRLEEIKNDNSMSEEDKQKHIEKVEYMIEQRDSSNMARATYSHPKTTGSLKVPHCKQETDSYCGPATAQQTYKFYKGKAPTQKDLADGVKYTPGVGCDVQNILDYLNDSLDTTYEQFWLAANATNEDGSVRLICESIDNQCPPIMWVSVSDEWGGTRDSGIENDTSKWPYTVGGHFLNASGYKQNGKLLEMTDPWLTWKYTSNTTGKFWVTRHTVYMVTNVVSA